MKVSINQVKINRVGINTAQVRGIRLGSASKGGQTSPFHPSLVDYWSFKGKSNADEDRDTIKGIKGEILTAYNFGWSLGSGYGLYGTDFRVQWNDTDSSYGKVVTSTTAHADKVGSGLYVIAYANNRVFADTFKGRVSGMPEGYSLYIGFASTLHLVSLANGEWSVDKADIPYFVPEGSPESDARYNGGFKIMKTGNLGGGQEVPADVTIELFPECPGAIVTDGVDDYLKLDKVGYKIGTVIIKFVPIKFNVGWNTVFDNNKYDSPNRNFLGYSSTIENRGTTMFVSNYGDYLALYHNTPKQANDSLYISSSYTESFTAKEFFSMALYDIAIYQDVLTAEEIQKEINVMEYGTPNPVFALNFDNFAYKAVDYPDFATGKVTTNKIVVDSTTETFNGAIAVAMNPEANTGEPIEVPSYKIKVTGLNQYSVGEGNWAVGLMGMMIDSTKEPWTYPIYKDGVYDIPAISLSDRIYNLGIMAQIAIDKPIGIEVLYDKNVTKSFPENKQIFP